VFLKVDIILQKATQPNKKLRVANLFYVALKIQKSQENLT
jgi:hypothetical protein